MPSTSLHDGGFDGKPLSNKDIVLFMIMILCFMLGGTCLLAFFIV